MTSVKRVLAVMMFACVILTIAGCADSGISPASNDNVYSSSGNTISSSGSVSSSDAADSGSGSTAPVRSDNVNEWEIRIADKAGNVLWRFTESELRLLEPERTEMLSYTYSTVNNWPAPRFYVANGYSVSSILRAAGAFDSARTVTFLAADGYGVSLTREQLFAEQYCFPHVNEDPEDAAPVQPMIAFRWREGAEDIGEIRDDKPIFIFGQRTPFEHTNPAFVVGVAEIIIDDSECEVWQTATTFPEPGEIDVGETVKLQHPAFGLVKMYYTLDGSDPTAFSTMYNPSTYQPELNRPILISAPTTIRVLVTGYGKNDSEIAVFEFIPLP